MSEIKSIEELRKAQAAAQIQGASITNYEQWADIMEDLDKLGVQSTGSYDGDVRLYTEIIEGLEAAAQAAQEAQNQQKIQPNNDEISKIEEKTSNDREQTVKANVANNVSGDIMANYMKYYHMV